MKIIAFILVDNEEELIEKCIENAWEQGLDVIVIDSGSTDSTIGIVKKLGVPVIENKTIIHNPWSANNWAIAKVKKIGCDWYVEKDPDEMFETYDGRKIIDVVKEADDLGYNCMCFDMYEFWPTVDDDLTIKDFTKRIQYYSYYSSNYLKMIKNSTEISTSGPHRPRGLIKESPNRLLFRHYRFISLEQGKKKAANRLRKYDFTRSGNLPFYDFDRRFSTIADKGRFYILEKNIYSKLYKFDGTWVKKKVFDGWRGY